MDIAGYQRDIASIDLTPILLTTNDVTVICKYYHDQVMTIVNHYSPYRTLTNEELKWIEKPWISKNIQSLIKEKNYLYHKYLSKNRDQFWYGRYTDHKDKLLKPWRNPKLIILLDILRKISITQKKSGTASMKSYIINSAELIRTFFLTKMAIL